MVNFPFRHPVTSRRVDPSSLEGILRSFEDAWANRTGERISSAEFYDRYRAGEIDSLLAMNWATYYEIFRRRTDDPVATAIAATLSA
jgi:hypothetical protein